MTYRTLLKDLSKFTEEQLDNHVVIEVNDFFHNACSLEVASGEGDYLYRGEVFFSIDSEPLGEKEEEEE
jgi:hypothetical protein